MRDTTRLRKCARDRAFCLQVAGACDRNVDTWDISTNRDLTRILTDILPRHPAIRLKDKSERSVLRLPCAKFSSFVTLSAFLTTAHNGDS